MNSALPQCAGWQACFLQILPSVESHVKFKFRRLRPEQRDEAIQQAIASACVSYQTLAAQGKLHVAHPSTLGRYAVRFVRNGRHVGGRQDAAKDVLSPACQRRHGVRAISIDLPPNPRRRQRMGGHRRASSASSAEGWKQLVVADRKASIPDTVAFRLDFASWLAALSRRNRRIIRALCAGEPALAVAARHGLSAGRVSQLRRSYARAWDDFQRAAAVS
jgi:hypothetical protein